MGTPWDVATVGWTVTVVSWLLTPIIASLAPKILSYLALDPEKKLVDLEFRIIPELQKILQAVDQERMMRRGDEKRMKGDVAKLDKLAAMLRHAQEDTEDIFDDAGEKIVSRYWQRLYGAFAACISLCKSSCVWIARTVHTRSSRTLQWLQRWRSQEPSSQNNSVHAGQLPVQLPPPTRPLPLPPNPAATNEIAVTMDVSFGRRLISCLCSSFDFFKNCCTSLYNWLVHVFESACFYRDWSYEVVGIKKFQKNATALDSALTAISRWKLKKRIEKVENTVSEVKKSPLLGGASNTTPDDIANKNRSKIRTASNRVVFGREALRDSVMARLREISPSDAPSSSTSLCYSVIGIYGIAGSGKTTFARYIRDYIEEECKEEKLFDIIMCIHVSETFSVNDIFREMLKNVTTSDRITSRTGCEELKKMVKKALRNKRFFLILDDLWVKNKYDPQLEELISPLNAGWEGSKILVTARTKEAAGALCADEPIEMPDLDEDLYLKMFMHYALAGKRVVEEEFEPVGRVIAENLHRSPIAAVSVAGRLRRNLDIKFWKNTAKLDKLNYTMDALWWSYRFLNPDIRRCFEYCNIFPRRTNLRRDKLVCMWIAQGFVKTSSAAENMEDVAEGYVQELASCLFLQPQGKRDGTDWFTIHDLLHDLLDKVTGSDCFRIGNGGSQTEGWKGDVPPDVRHLFVQNYDGELITKNVLGLENLRTLIIYENDTLVEEKVIESICTRLPKLRVLAIVFNQESDPIWSPNKKFLVPESIIQLKHLRYLTIRIECTCTVILPSTLAELHHIQLLDFGHGQISEFTFVDLINLRHIFCGCCENFPNVINDNTMLHTRQDEDENNSSHDSNTL